MIPTLMEVEEMTKQKLQNLLHGMLIGLGIHEPTVPTSAYTDLRAEFFGTCKRINRLAQPRARYREELAKRKSEPTNSIPTECRKAQPVSDQTFYLVKHSFFSIHFISDNSFSGHIGQLSRTV